MPRIPVKVYFKYLVIIKSLPFCLRCWASSPGRPTRWGGVLLSHRVDQWRRKIKVKLYVRPSDASHITREKLLFYIIGNIILIGRYSCYWWSVIDNNVVPAGQIFRITYEVPIYVPMYILIIILYKHIS